MSNKKENDFLLKQVVIACSGPGPLYAKRKNNETYSDNLNYKYKKVQLYKGKTGYVKSFDSMTNTYLICLDESSIVICVMKKDLEFY